MPASGRMWRKRGLGIIVCALMAGPILSIIAYLKLALFEQTRLENVLQRSSFANLWWLWIDLAVLVTLTFLFFGIPRRRLRGVWVYTLVPTMLYGAVCYIVSFILLLLLFGEQFDRRWPEVVRAIPGGAVLGAIYWLLAGRAEEHDERARQREARAIAAMD